MPYSDRFDEMRRSRRNNEGLRGVVEAVIQRGIIFLKGMGRTKRVTEAQTREPTSRSSEVFIRAGHWSALQDLSAAERGFASLSSHLRGSGKRVPNAVANIPQTIGPKLIGIFRNPPERC